MIQIRACRRRSELRRFETLPEALHGDHPSFTPPVPGSTMALFTPDHPVQQHVRTTPYLAWRDGQPVGRIASIVNETHNRVHDDAVGFFGFFDTVRDPAVGEALFAQVTRDLIEAGRDTVRGPYSPTSNYECGLLVDGAEGRPAFLMPWNPPWYEEIYEALGLRGVRDLHTYDLVDPQRYEALSVPFVERARSLGFSVRSAASNLEDEVDLILHFFNEGLSEEWGFMPMTRPELQRSIRELRPIADSELVFFLERNGEALGFALGFPDLNEWLHELSTTPRWLRLPRLFWWTRTRSLHRVRFALVAVLPPARRVGGGSALLVDEVIRRPRGRYPAGAEISWIQDINSDMQRVAAEGELPRTRTHRIYEMTLNSSGQSGVEVGEGGG